MKRGVTLVELLVVAAIVAVLAALVSPALFGAVERGRKTNCVNHLRQVHLALALYREDHGGATEGSATAMGYPPFLTFAVRDRLDPRLLHCPRTPNEYIQSPGAVGYILMAVDRQPATPRTDFAAHVARVHSAAIEVVDVNHKTPTTDLHAPLTTKHAFGLTVGGSLVTRTKRGDWGDLRWWERAE